MTRPSYARFFLILAAVEILCFGLFAPQLGFYHDDWANLELLAGGGGFLPQVRLYAGLVSERPLAMLHFPLFYALGGLHPLPYHLAYAALEIIQGCLLFVLMESLLDWPSLSLLASVLALAYPSRSVIHVWFSSSSAIVALDLTLLGLIFHQSSKGENRRLLICGQLCYLLALLEYEAAAFLPLMLAGAWTIQARDRGQPWLRAAASSLKRLWPFALSLAAALSWQRAAIFLFSKPNPRPVGPSLGHLLKAFGAGFECLTTRALDASVRMTGAAWYGLGMKALLGACAAAAAIAALLPRPEPERRAAADPSLKIAVGAGIGAFVGAYAPYALSADYMPMIFGVMSRTNVVGTTAGGLLIAAGLAAWSRCSPRLARATLAALGGIFLMADWGFSWQWAQSWRLQTDILRRMSRRVTGLPPSSKILLSGFTGSVEPGGALVFGANYDISAALRLTSHRPDLSADLVRPGVSRSGINIFEYSYLGDKLRPLEAVTSLP